MNSEYSKPWVQRHWILLLVLAAGFMLVLLIGLFLITMYSVMTAMKGSPVYIEAMNKARASTELAAALGRPIEDEPWLVGASQRQEGEGHAFFIIPVHGPKGTAEVHADADLHDGVWTFRTLRAKPEHSSDFIDLREADSATR
ncbi:cytochrome c oxidase assembly factor Coa1 family protein [Lysobacter sp. TAB13]|uniref:cytochrome c oxidase assembly factor Coa1 family protein n=1 Tax=Lysobacter sp. TAB13 TaxID=3233065 RepID=UPI003F9A7A70